MPNSTGGNPFDSIFYTSSNFVTQGSASGGAGAKKKAATEDSTTIYINPYNRHSRSAKALAEALGAKLYTGRYSGSVKWSNKTVINWGNPGFLVVSPPARTVNLSENIPLATDKRRFFDTVSPAARVPPYTTNSKEAVQWAKNGETVIGRKYLSSSGGKGILFFEDCDLSEFMDCKLFTKYVKNIAEYRVHIAFGEVIDIQKKGRRSDADPEADHRIKNHSNGYVFMRQNITVPADVSKQALAAYKALGLDFAAFDVIYNQHYDRAYVLEANTAPGLEGATVESYASAFRKELEK